jgi:hypothetical protein
LTTRSNKTSIAQLRTSDATRLQVLVPEALGMPLGQIEPATLLDLLALSELSAQLSPSLLQDLVKFQKRMFDQITDLPDGPTLANFIGEIQALSAENVPQCLRVHLSEILPMRAHPGALTALQALAEQLANTPPAAITLPAAPAASSAATSTTKAKKPRKTRVSASQVDPQRAEWIEVDVIDRLQNYGNKGLKESVLVAGALKRASWEDLTSAEVLAVLRRLKRETKVRYSAGRWSILS